MAKKPKYFFDPHSLSFQKVKFSWRKILLRGFGILCLCLVFGSATMFLAYTYLDSPKEKILKEEIKQYQYQLSLVEKSVDDLSASMGQLSKRDNEIYRTIFEAEPMHDTDYIKLASLEYRNLQGYDDAAAVQRLREKLEALGARMKAQAKSYDQIMLMAQRKEDMLASIPAIQPIPNKDLTRMASGYGYRIHPIYKTAKMHTGMDFTAPKGTDIFATGNGVVEYVGTDGGGYGSHVIINHGYGYETLYGHMSSFSVRQGQNVKRGEKIGEVGSSGLSSGPHLHYEVIKNGNKVNPVHFYFNDLSPEDYERIKKLAETNNQSFD